MGYDKPMPSQHALSRLRGGRSLQYRYDENGRRIRMKSVWPKSIKPPKTHADLKKLSKPEFRKVESLTPMSSKTSPNSRPKKLSGREMDMVDVLMSMKKVHKKRARSLPELELDTQPHKKIKLESPCSPKSERLALRVRSNEFSDAFYARPQYYGSATSSVREPKIKLEPKH